MKLRRPTKRTSAIILTSIVFVLIAGVYTWLSLRAWSAYETRLTQEQNEYMQLKDTALHGDSTEKRLAAIRTLDDKLDARENLCKISPLYAWQSAVISQLRDGVQKCKDKVRQLGRVAVPLKALREYLGASEKVQGILQTLNPGEALTEGNWTVNGLERATKAAKDLKALQLKGDAAKLKDKAVTLSDSLVISWQNLIKAHDAKDKSAFLSASAAVAKGYADFMGLADTADATLEQKVNAVVIEANKL